jgi:hypothetical protein
VNGLKVGGGPGHNQKSAARKSRARRESEFNVAGEPKTADVLVERIRVEQFDKLQFGHVRADENVARVIHDFRNHQPGAPA